MQDKNIYDPMVMAGYNVTSQHPQFAANQEFQEEQMPEQGQMQQNPLDPNRLYNSAFIEAVNSGLPYSDALMFAAELENKQANVMAQQQQQQNEQFKMSQLQLKQQRDAALQQILPEILQQVDPTDVQGMLATFAQVGLDRTEAIALANAISNFPQELQKEELKHEYSLESKAAEGANLTLKQKLDVEEGLRKEHTSASKNFKEINDSFERIKSLAKLAQKESSPAAGIGVIFSYMRMLDPTSTVREGEYATAENAGGIPTRIQQQYNKALSGEPLTKSQIADFVRGSKSVFDAQKQNQSKLDSEFKKRAKKAGVDPEEVFTSYDADSEVDRDVTGDNQVFQGTEPLFDFSKLSEDELNAERELLRKQLGQ